MLYKTVQSPGKFIHLAGAFGQEDGRTSSFDGAEQVNVDSPSASASLYSIGELTGSRLLKSGVNRKKKRDMDHAFYVQHEF